LENLHEANEATFALLIAAFFAAIAAIISWVFLSPRTRPLVLPFEGVVAPFFGLPAVLFSLTAALFASSIWENYNSASRAVRNESQGIANLISLADSITSLRTTALANAAKEYARSVVEDEWPTLSIGSKPSPRTHERFVRLREQIFRGGETLNKTEFEALLNAYLRVNNARESRLAFVSFDVHPVRWYAILAWVCWSRSRLPLCTSASPKHCLLA
jgi:hypothetical protein